MSRVFLCAIALALALAACSGGPSGDDVVAQARPGGQFAFDVVKLDDGVLKTVLAQRAAAFDERFRRYVPPPALKIAVGDVVAVVIWEAGDDGLFGNSLLAAAAPEGAAGATRLGRGFSASLPSSLPGGLPSGLPGGLADSPDTTAALFGTRAQSGEAGAAQAPAASPAEPQSGRAGDAERGQFPSAIAESFGPGATPRPAAGFAAATGDGSAEVERLLDLASQGGRPGTRIPDQPVGPDGAISIPYGGRIAVAGRTPAEAQQAIEARLAKKALDPRALVVVRRSAANSVSVAGEGIGGKRVALSPGGDRLLQVIAAAGGAHAPVHDTFVRLSRRGVTATVPLATLVADPKEDIFAEPGDVVTLVQRPQTFSVFGATGRNAAITFTSDRLSLDEALAKAGGLNDNQADPRAVFLFRYEPRSLVRALGQPIATGAPSGYSPVVYSLDLSQARSYLLARRFPVHDKDVIFVADAKLHQAYQFFQALSHVAGPVETGLITCLYAHC
ncbi:MAG TPA: polysaccharide biosynthesis/export family protein [Stellaceae bacterium]|nr:polysaccharide biosynthesis/export family protein [Stellaceae bacterium]